jgi:hypothetical protein
MTMTGEITTAREGWLVRASLAVARWSRRRTVRSDIADIYNVGDEARRASIEEQLLLDRECRAARQELDRTIAMSRLYRGF